jgi:hypothetical protein
MRIELTTYSLGSCRSTTELRPRARRWAPAKRRGLKHTGGDYSIGGGAAHARRAVALEVAASLILLQPELLDGRFDVGARL